MSTSTYNHESFISDPVTASPTDISSLEVKTKSAQGAEKSTTKTNKKKNAKKVPLVSKQKSTAVKEQALDIDENKSPTKNKNHQNNIELLNNAKRKCSSPMFDEEDDGDGMMSIPKLDEIMSPPKIDKMMSAPKLDEAGDKIMSGQVDKKNNGQVSVEKKIENNSHHVSFISDAITTTLQDISSPEVKTKAIQRKKKLRSKKNKKKITQKVSLVSNQKSSPVNNEQAVDNVHIKKRNNQNNNELLNNAKRKCSSPTFDEGEDEMKSSAMFDALDDEMMSIPDIKQIPGASQVINFLLAQESESSSNKNSVETSQFNSYGHASNSDICVEKQSETNANFSNIKKRKSGRPRKTPESLISFELETYSTTENSENEDIKINWFTNQAVLEVAFKNKKASSIPSSCKSRSDSFVFTQKTKDYL